MSGDVGCFKPYSHTWLHGKTSNAETSFFAHICHWMPSRCNLATVCGLESAGNMLALSESDAWLSCIGVWWSITQCVNCWLVGCSIALPNDSTNTYVRALKDSVLPDTSMVVAILPSNRKDRYDAIKIQCCVESPGSRHFISLLHCLI